MSPAGPSSSDSTLVNALRELLRQRDGGEVELVETHISWVLLTLRLALKLKKPVRLPFLDASTPVLRLGFCQDELRLNRRFAPGLYRAVIAVRGTPAAPGFRGAGEPIDWLVCMRRFPPGSLLSERLERKQLQADDLLPLARYLAVLQQTAPALADSVPLGWPEQVLQAMLDVLKPLDEQSDECGATLRAWVDAQASVLWDAWQQRRRDGFVRECHGDLHLANIVMLGTQAVAFDCVEFAPALRWIDVMSDIAFPVMDLEARGRADLAFRFLDAWLQACGDFGGLRVLRFYVVYRALVRAMVGSLDPPPAADYVACALRWQAVAAPGLLITQGVSGSGKSFLATLLLERSGAIRVRSDVERKRLFGLPALDRSGPAQPDIYTEASTRRTFDCLLEAAQVALESGFPVIVDAAFLRRSERNLFHELAMKLRVSFTILHCQAPDDVLRERIARRNAAGDDASEATLAVLDRQLLVREPLNVDESRLSIDVRTDLPMDADLLASRWAAARRAPIDEAWTPS
jgi:aminoglycoside phosphotransferase family enzyme/predicted kinase